MLQNSPADVSRLLVKQLHKQFPQGKAKDVMLVWRIWLRVLLQSKKGNREATNSLLASILSGASEAVMRQVPMGLEIPALINRRVELTRVFFQDLTEYLVDPYDALLMLLFLLPARGNRFFEEYTAQARVEVFEPVLNYVDDFFIRQGHNIFKEYKWPDYEFILYQWSLSISMQGLPNSSVVDAEQRQHHVNDYVFGLLDGNPKQTYDFIYQQFWSNDGWSSESYEWRIESKLGQYNNQRAIDSLTRIASKATRSAHLTRQQQEHMKEFIDSLMQYKSKLVQGDE
jgi:hypothetical protein